MLWANSPGVVDPGRASFATTACLAPNIGLARSRANKYSQKTRPLLTTRNFHNFTPPRWDNLLGTVLPHQTIADPTERVDRDKAPLKDE